MVGWRAEEFAENEPRRSLKPFQAVLSLDVDAGGVAAGLLSDFVSLFDSDLLSDDGLEVDGVLPFLA